MEEQQLYIVNEILQILGTESDNEDEDRDGTDFELEGVTG